MKEGEEEEDSYSKIRVKRISTKEGTAGESVSSSITNASTMSKKDFISIMTQLVEDNK